MALGIGALLLLMLVNGGLSINALQDTSKRVARLAEVYVPLTDQAAIFQARLKDGPTNMNMYLLTGKQECWTATEAALKDAEQSLGILTKQVYTANAVENGLVDRAKAGFAQFSTVAREAHTANEGFIKKTEPAWSLRDSRRAREP